MASRNFATYFWTKFDAYKEQDAFVFLDENNTLTTEKYWDWTRRVRNLAIGFLERNYESGIRVAICTKDRKAFFDIAFATWMIGGCVVPIPSGRDRKETLRRLARCKVSVVFLDDAAAYDELVEDPTKIPPLDWVTIENNVKEPLCSLNTIIEKGKFRSKRGDLDLLAKRTFSTKGSSPALILNSFDSEVYASYYSNTKLALMMDYLGKSFEWSEDRIALQVDLGWFYGILLGTYSLINGASLVAGPSVSKIAESLGELEPTIIVGGPAYLTQLAESWRTDSEDISKLVDNISLPLGENKPSNWIQTLGSKLVASSVKKNIAEDFGKKLNHIYVVNAAVPDSIREVLELDSVKTHAMWGRSEIGISHIETTPFAGSVGRPIYGYACKTIATKSEEIGELAIRSDVIHDGYWGKEGLAELGKTWIKLPTTGKIVSGDLILLLSQDEEE